MSREFNCWSIDEEHYHEGGKYEALECLRDREELKVGYCYYLGEQKNVNASSFFCINSFLEYLGEQAYDEHGECAEDFPYVTTEKRNELESLIKNWLDNNINVDFWGVDEVTEFTVTEQDIKDME